MGVRENWEMECPKCQDDSHIDIVATVSVRLVPDGTDADISANGDHEWDDYSRCVCNACDFAGKVHQFRLEGK